MIPEINFEWPWFKNEEYLGLLVTLNQANKLKVQPNAVIFNKDKEQDEHIR